MGQTMLQYLSNAFTEIRKTFPNNANYSSSSSDGKGPQWYLELRYKCEKLKSVECVNSGELYQNGKTPMYRANVHDVNKALLSGDCSKQDVQMACVNAFNFACCGRTGEVTLLCVDMMIWNPLEGSGCLQLQWGDTKTGKHKPVCISFEMDEKVFLRDVMLMCAIYYGTGGPCGYNESNVTGKGQNRLFPNLATISGKHYDKHANTWLPSCE